MFRRLLLSPRARDQGTPAQSRYPFGAFPNGWFALGRSLDVPCGGVLRRRLAGRDVVLFRTQSGQLGVSEAFCPHLGAHLGHGGKVCGETLQCPFHAFRFAPSGECVATGYGGKVPPKARLTMLSSREQNGLVLAWQHAQGHGPTWEMPILSDDFVGLAYRQKLMRAHPQEIAENSVDSGHFAVLHGFGRPQTLREPWVEGPCLRARYAIERSAAFLGRSGTLRVEFDVEQHGLGFGLVRAEVMGFGLFIDLFVLARPEDAERTVLQLAARARPPNDPSKILPLFGNVLSRLQRTRGVAEGEERTTLTPLRWLTRAIAETAVVGLSLDVDRDVSVWENKAYVEQPPLAAGDGPIMLFRRWAKQFY